MPGRCDGGRQGDAQRPGKVQPAAREGAKHHVHDVFCAPSLEPAEERAAKVLRDYQKEYPVAMPSFNDDLQACLVYLRCRLAHHKAIRTTNLVERAFRESRRRTQVIPLLIAEKASLKLAFSTLWKTSQRWQRVTMTDLERQPLELLRQELGLSLYNQ